jgi:transposase
VFDGELGLARRERKELMDRVRSRTLPAEDVRRARLILLLAQGKSYSTIRQLPLSPGRLECHAFEYTPTYSCWLNQVENRFSRIEREVIARAYLCRYHFSCYKPLADNFLRIIFRRDLLPDKRQSVVIAVL